MSQTIDDLKPDPNAREKIKGSYDGSSDTTADVSHDTMDVAGDVADALVNATFETAEQLESLGTAAFDRASGAARYIRREANSHPLTALATAATAIAALAGLVAIFRRKNRMAS